MREPLMFSLNMHDSDGVPYEFGVYIHFDDTAIKVAKTLTEWKDFISQINDIDKEVSCNLTD